MRFSTRREFLKLSAIAAGALVCKNNAFAAAADHLAAPQKKLSFYNTHTGERLETTYWADGKYLPKALHEINHILRDYRTEEIKPIDPRLLDILYSIRKKVNARHPFHIISGYRSPKTNSLLKRTTSGVAGKSLHLEGKAIDVRLPGYKLGELWKAALELKSGGVGYYRSSNFVHLDTGRVRHWRS